MKKYRYKIEAIFVTFLFWIFKRMNIEKSAYICGFIAKTIGPHLSVSNTARNNLKIAKIEDSKHEDIIKSMWNNLGMVAGEFPHIYNMSKDDLFSRVNIINEEEIEFAKHGKKQVIFFSGHLANWEIGARVAASKGVKLALVYRKLNNSDIDKIVLEERSKNDITAIVKGREGSRKIVEILNQNRSLAMLVDQKFNEGIAIPFFGKPVMTAPAIAKLAAKYDIPIIPTQVIREKNLHFTVKFFPAINVNKNEENYIYNTMLNINQILEKWIIEKPEQWFWLHKRWGK